MSDDKRPSDPGAINDDLDPSAQEMLRQVSRRRARIEKRRREGDRSLWSTLGLSGVVGWTVIFPALAGGFLGRYLDKRWGTEQPIMTLSLLMVGLAVGCFATWRLLHERDE